MFGIGLPELLLIMAVALIVVGPEKLPDLAKSLAKGILELKKTASALKDSLTEVDDQMPPKEPWQQLTQGEYPPEVTGVNDPVSDSGKTGNVTGENSETVQKDPNRDATDR